MKRNPIRVIQAMLCGCMALASFAVLARTTYVWNPSGNGGWQASSQYVNAGGAVPTAHDVVQIPENVTVEISTDADAAFVNTLDGVELTAASSTFVFNQPSDIQWQCAVFGQGTIIKRTAATVELMANTQTDLYAEQYKGYLAYCSWNGLNIENGILKLPQTNSGGAYSFGPVTMNENTTLFLIPDNATQLAALNGYGTVTNTASTGYGAELQIGYMAYADQTVSHFYGKLMGGIRWYSTGTVYLHGTNSLFAGWTFMHWGRYSERDTKHGHLYLTKFGRTGTTSSIGANYRAAIESRIGGAFHYLGDGEDTNKAFSWTPYDGAEATIMDAGATGGVTFSGAWSHVNTTTSAMGCLRLTGSNAVPCVVTGKVSTPSDVTTYFTKEGSGTWRFVNDVNEQNGAMAINDGVFQFTSIAEAGSHCALGLSTLLHEPYIGPRDDSKVASYAFLLGGNGTFPTFEYMGGKASACTTRPLALTGRGGRLSSSGAGSMLKFAGISAYDAGEKTLALGGDSTGYNMVSNITSGSGSVAVTKEGAGRWVVAGANALSSKLEVKEGTLELWDRYAGESYTWYRLVIKSLSSVGMAYVPEFALYDAAGSNRVAGLKYRVPDQYAGGIASSFVSFTPVATSNLRAGEVLFYSASGSDVYHYYGDQNLDSLFDGAVEGSAGKWRLNIVSNLPNGTAERYIYVVMRLPDDVPPLVRYDIDVGTQQKTVRTFAVEASKDGENWVALTDDVTTSDADKWSSGDEFVAGHPLRPGKGLTLNVPAAPDANGAAMLDNVTSIQVATGATLVAKGVSKTIRNLTVDCSKGVGTLSGFDFVANGTIDLINIPEGATGFAVPAGLIGVSAESLANLNGYSVTVEGDPTTRWRVTVSANSIRASLLGTRLSIR